MITHYIYNCNNKCNIYCIKTTTIRSNSPLCGKIQTLRLLNNKAIKFPSIDITHTMITERLTKAMNIDLYKICTFVKKKEENSLYLYKNTIVPR